MASVYMFGPNGTTDVINVGETAADFVNSTSALSLKESQVTASPTDIWSLMRDNTVGHYYSFNGSNVVIAYLQPPNVEEGFYWAKKSGSGFTYAVSSWTASRLDRGNHCYFFKTKNHASIGSDADSTTYDYVLSAYGDWQGIVNTIINGGTSPKWEGGGGSGGFPSTPGGGGGSQSTSSVEIPKSSFSTDPNDSNFVYGVEDTDSLALYAPTRAQMREFTNYLWSQGYLDTLKKKITDPLDLLVTFNLFPFEIPTSGQAVVAMGKVILHEDFKLNDIPSQFLTIDCGSLRIDEFWGNCLDYSPFTKIDIYLPYIGYQSLSADDVMNSTINLQYNIDLLSCSCVATLYVTRNSDNVNLNAPLYSFSGCIGSKVPLTSRDMSEVWNAVSRAAISVTQSAATAYMATSKPKNPMSMDDAVAGMAPDVAGASADMISSKISFPRSGSLSMNTGILAPQTPFIIINRPQQSLPDGYQTVNGYPCNVHVNLGAISGFTIVDNIHLDGFSATQEELDELKRLLKAGVIL